MQMAMQVCVSREMTPAQLLVQARRDRVLLMAADIVCEMGARMPESEADHGGVMALVGFEKEVRRAVRCSAVFLPMASVRVVAIKERRNDGMVDATIAIRNTLGIQKYVKGE